MIKSITRRSFLEKFAKASTATLAVGICVACPAPSEGIPYDREEIEVREVEYEGDILDVHLFVDYEDDEVTIAKIETLKVTSEDGAIIDFIKTLKESSFTDRLAFTITFAEGSLEYETKYSVKINDTTVLYSFSKKF